MGNHHSDSNSPSDDTSNFAGSPIENGLDLSLPYSREQTKNMIRSLEIDMNDIDLFCGQNEFLSDDNSASDISLLLGDEVKRSVLIGRSEQDYQSPNLVAAAAAFDMKVFSILRVNNAHVDHILHQRYPVPYHVSSAEYRQRQFHLGIASNLADQIITSTDDEMELLPGLNCVKVQTHLLKYSKHIVGIAMGKGTIIGTGVLISSTLILTARHILEDINDITKQITIRLNCELITGVGISWGEIISVVNVFYDSEIVDCAILEVAAPLNENYEGLKIPGRNKPDAMTAVMFLHHPNAGVKRVSIRTIEDELLVKDPVQWMLKYQPETFGSHVPSVLENDCFQNSSNSHHSSSSGGAYFNVDGELVALQLSSTSASLKTGEVKGVSNKRTTKGESTIGPVLIRDILARCPTLRKIILGNNMDDDNDFNIDRTLYYDELERNFHNGLFLAGEEHTVEHAIPEHDAETDQQDDICRIRKRLTKSRLTAMVDSKQKDNTHNAIHHDHHSSNDSKLCPKLLHMSIDGENMSFPQCRYEILSLDSELHFLRYMLATECNKIKAAVIPTFFPCDPVTFTVANAPWNYFLGPHLPKIHDDKLDNNYKKKSQTEKGGNSDSMTSQAKMFSSYADFTKILNSLPATKTFEQSFGYSIRPKSFPVSLWSAVKHLSFLLDEAWVARHTLMMSKKRVTPLPRVRDLLPTINHSALPTIESHISSDESLMQPNGIFGGGRGIAIAGTMNSMEGEEGETIIKTAPKARWSLHVPTTVSTDTDGSSGSIVSLPSPVPSPFTTVPFPSITSGGGIASKGHGSATQLLRKSSFQGIIASPPPTKGRSKVFFATSLSQSYDEYHNDMKPNIKSSRTLSPHRAESRDDSDYLSVLYRSPPPKAPLPKRGRGSSSSHQATTEHIESSFIDTESAELKSHEEKYLAILNEIVIVLKIIADLYQEMRISTLGMPFMEEGYSDILSQDACNDENKVELLPITLLNPQKALIFQTLPSDWTLRLKITTGGDEMISDGGCHDIDGKLTKYHNLATDDQVYGHGELEIILIE